MKTKGKPAAALCAVLSFALLAGCAHSGHPSPSSDMPAAGTPAPVTASVPVSEPTPSPEPEPVDSETARPEETPAPEELVRIADYIPDIYVELRYASEDNFTGAVIYDFDEAYLRYGTVMKLAAAQEALSQAGLSLKIWDAFRPVQAQFTLWEVCPDPNYVANPETGYSGHSRGDTVDATLVRADGSAVEMPTDFDDFSVLADRDYSDVSSAAAENARLLESVMTQAGFEAYYNEWWHFSDAAVYSVYQGELPK